MKSIIIVMLCVQVLMILALAYAVAVRKPSAAKPAPLWSSLAASLVIVCIASFQIGGSHEGQEGVDVLMFGGAVLLGMALMCMMLTARARLVRHRIA